jgi:hypothetical protein
MGSVLSVVMDGYHGDWRAAIDEAYELSKKLNIGCSLILKST